MIRRPPRSTQSRSSAASDVYKRQGAEPLGVLDDDLHAARQLEGLEDVRDSHRGASRRAGRDVQAARRLMSPLRHTSDSTWNVRSLRASKSASDFSSAR